MNIKHILMVTGNQGKAREFSKLLNLPDVRISFKALPLVEIQNMDIAEVGRVKTLSALKQLGGFGPPDAVLTDDTGLYCQGLNGLPGTMVKWFLGALGTEGFFHLVENKITSASVVCQMSLGIVSSEEIVQFQAEIQGNMVAPRGKFGFGWDSIFQPQGSNKTYGEMNAQEKNKISHRMLATLELRQWLAQVVQ